MVNRIARLVLVAAAVAAAPVARAGAQESRPSIAIMAFRNEGPPQSARDYAGLETAIAEFLGAELSGNTSLRVIERGDVRRAIDAQHVPAGTRPSREAAVAAAKALGAQKMIVGRFMADARGNLRVDSRVVDVASGAIDYTDRLQDRGDNIVPLVGQLATRMIAGLGLPAAPRATAGPALPMRDAILYGQALDAADRGERARATELYEAVLKGHPDYEPARRGLAKLKPGA